MTNNLSPQKSENFKKMGRYMVVIMWMIIFGFMYYGFSRWLEKENNPNPNPVTLINADGSRQVVIMRNKRAHYLVDGTINQKKVTFFLDTGSTYVAIPKKIASQLGLTAGASTNISTVNGSTKANFTRIDILTIGNLEFSDVKAVIVNNLNEDYILLGMNVLKNVKFSQEADALIIQTVQ